MTQSARELDIRERAKTDFLVGWHTKIDEDRYSDRAWLLGELDRVRNALHATGSKARCRFCNGLFITAKCHYSIETAEHNQDIPDACPLKRAEGV